MTDEAYTFQLWKMMDIQNEIIKQQTMSGLITIHEDYILLKKAYFAKVVSLFDTWHFKPIQNDMFDHEVWGYINKAKFSAFCTDHELVDMLSDNIANFAKEKPAEADNSKNTIDSTKINTGGQVEPNIMKIFENVFGGNK